MIDGRDEIAGRNGIALVIGDRHQRHVAEPDVERLEIGQVLAAMQSCQGLARNRPEQWKVKLIDVEMENVEFLGTLAHAVEHEHVVWDRVAHIEVQPQRHGSTGNEMGAGYRVAACEQRYFVTQSHQFVSQIGKRLRPSTPVQPRGHALRERRDLRNFHGKYPLREDPTAPQRIAPRKSSSIRASAQEHNTAMTEF